MQGHSDVPLNPDGTAQAERIGARMSVHPFPPEIVYSSDLSRAVETAEAVAKPLNLEVKINPMLRETMLGEWEGLTRAEIIERGDGDLLEKYIADSYYARPPGGESLDNVWDRMLTVFSQIIQEHPESRIAIIGHGGSLRSLICHTMDAPVTSMRRIWLDNASLSVLDYAGPSASHNRILLLNDTSHLQS